MAFSLPPIPGTSPNVAHQRTHYPHKRQLHPLVSWANRQARRERERSTDAEVLAHFDFTVEQYAGGLLDDPRPGQFGERGLRISIDQHTHKRTDSSNQHCYDPAGVREGLGTNGKPDYKPYRGCSSSFCLGL